MPTHEQFIADGWSVMEGRTKADNLYYKDEVITITQADLDEFAESQWVDPMERDIPDEV